MGSVKLRSPCYVIGVGMTKFEKPGRRADFDYPDMAKESVTKALADAGISYNKVEQACVGYVYGDSTCGQRALYQMGMTGIPVMNVNNNCSTGSTALYMGKQLIEGGISDCVLALGFEKMQRGSLSSVFEDRTNPMDKHVGVMMEARGFEPAPVAAQMFGNAGIEHMEKYGTTATQLAKIAFKNHKHSINNPYSQFQDEYTLDQIMNSPQVFGPLTKLQCCPTSDGSAAALLASEEFVLKHNLQSKAVEIVGMEMVTDLASTFEENSCIKVVGYDMTKTAREKLCAKTGISTQDCDVVELHDCFSANELITYEALGLCGPGEAGAMIDSGNNTYGGKFVINPSGGLISKGHPLGATGIAQCSELCWQLRGEADKRQVKGAKLGLQHNIGLGGAVVVAMYQKGFPSYTRPRIGASATSSTMDAAFTPPQRSFSSLPAPSYDTTAPSHDITPSFNLGSHATSSLSSHPTASSSEFKCSPIFEGIKAALEEDGASIIKQVNAVFCFKVKSGPGGALGTWVVDAKNGKGSVTFGGDGKSDVTITLADADLVELSAGTLNPQKAFFQGRLKIAGNMGLAMKLQTLLQREATKIKSALEKPAAPAAPAPGAGFKCSGLFDEIRAAFQTEGGDLVKKINGVFMFKVSGGPGGKEGVWVVDAKNGTGSVEFGKQGKCDVTISLSDDNLVDLMLGKLNPQKAFFSGKLKISGNMGMAMKMQEITKAAQNKLKPKL